MTTVVGKLNQSITGLVRFTPDTPFIDYSTTPHTLVSLPYEAPIASGTFSIVVPQSQALAEQPNVTTEGVTYKIELLKDGTDIKYYFLNGTLYEGATHLHSDSFYYTGSVHDGTSVRVDRVVKSTKLNIQNPFHAVVPNVASADITTLMSVSTQKPYLDISAYRIAELLTTNATYRDRISSKLSIKGAYATNTFYQLGDIVSYNGNSYVWRNPSSLQNATPPLTGDNANWLMIAAKGAAGGTGAQIVGYNATNWTGSSEAAARGDVKDAIASIPNPDLSTYLTKAEGLPRANPVMTGAVKRGAMSYPVPSAEKATEVVTAQHVEDAIAVLGAGNKLPAPLIFARRSSSISIGQDGRVTIAWNPRVINQGTILDANGRITIPESGSYLFMLSLQATITGNYQSSQGQVQIRYRSILRNVGAAVDAGDFFNYTYGATQASFTNKQFGFRFENALAAGTTLEIDATTQAIGATSVISSSQIDGTQANNYFAMWRVA